MRPSPEGWRGYAIIWEQAGVCRFSCVIGMLTDRAGAAQSYAHQIMELREGAAAYWLDKVLPAGRRYWTTGGVAARTTSR